MLSWDDMQQKDTSKFSVKGYIEKYGQSHRGLLKKSRGILVSHCGVKFFAVVWAEQGYKQLSKGSKLSVKGLITLTLYYSVE